MKSLTYQVKTLVRRTQKVVDLEVGFDSSEDANREFVRRVSEDPHRGEMYLTANVGNEIYVHAYDFFSDEHGESTALLVCLEETSEGPARIKQELPNTLSGLLQVAINDAKGLDPKLYNPSALYWHSGAGAAPSSPLCRVCLAGSVLVGSLGYDDPFHSFYMDEVNDETARKLNAINTMRSGEFGRAYLTLHNLELTEENVFDLPKALTENTWNHPKVSNQGFQNWTAFNLHLISLRNVWVWLKENNL